MTTPDIVSRAEAKARGLKKYFTGKPCPKGHVDDRSMSGACVACKKDWANKNPEYWKDRYWEDPEAEKAKTKEYRDATGYNAKRYSENKESELARNAQYAKDNREALSQKATQRRHDNVELFNARVRARRSKRPEVHLANNLRRRSSRVKATPPWFGEFDEFVFIEAADLTRRRERATGIKWHVDHCIPLQAEEACGLHIASNAQVIPAKPNIAKRNRMILTKPLEWLSLL